MIRINSKMNPPRQRRRALGGATQKDIADALGLAQSTVATALNPKTEHRLLSETVDQIKAYALKIGYRPQRFAQIMRGEKTQVVGVVAQIGMYSANHELVRQLANALNHAGYRLVMVDPEWFDGDVELVFNYLHDQAVEGVILCNVTPISETETLARRIPETVPLVTLSSGTLENAPMVRVDTHAVYRELTRYHLALGSQWLTCLSIFRDPGTLWQPNWSVRERITGFMEAIRETGGIVIADEATQEVLGIQGCSPRLPKRYAGVAGEVIYPVRPAKTQNAFEHGYSQTTHLFRRKQRPQSLICANDDIALGALAACADHGLSVPADLRISGHDDTAAGKFALAPLTTVRRPLKEMAEKAVEIVLHGIRNPETPLKPARHFGTATILLRRSTASRAEHECLIKTGFLLRKVPHVSLEFDPESDRLLQATPETKPPIPSRP